LSDTLLQLAEAILSEPVNNTDLEEVGSIRVTDTRTWSRSGSSRAGGADADGDEDEQQFLVGGDLANDEDNEGEDRKVRVRSHSSNGERADGLGMGRLGVMGNAGAQLSRLDVDNSNSDLNGGDELQDNVSGGGLSAKAGIILVCHSTLT
jgi:solute carrier family 45 protein 1/2/4